MDSKFEQLKSLIGKYNEYKKTAKTADISEESIRVWINDMLAIFGWDVHDTAQIHQEKKLDNTQKSRLEQIESFHSRPDYTLVNGKIVKSYLDAKNISVDIFKNKEAAFQIRSYGWSAGVPCAFLSNFEQFAIYDCRNIPQKDEPADIGVIHLCIDDYLSQFDVLNSHLDRTAVYNNRLEELYVQRKIEGQKTVDVYFNELLSEFRLKLAKNIYAKNVLLDIDEEHLNYYVQIIIDRIIFIRVCESRQIEERELLKRFVEKGFWKNFKESCYAQFYEHYDGAMFSDVDEVFNLMDIDDFIFEEFIHKLYYPYPYKFDVIPVHVIAKVYESFLAYSLVVKNNKVKIELKSEYVKTKGAIPTDENIAEAICKETLDIDQVSSINDLLKVQILDPCCGSGIFLVSAYEILSNKLKEILEPGDSGYCVIEDGEKHLTICARRELMRSCLYGLDIDPIAVEVTKMSLALKLIDDIPFFIYSASGVFGEKILRDIHNNIVCGNTLVDADIKIDKSEISEIRPIDIRRLFRNVFKKNSGFSYIIGNPPYVETKHFKAESQTVHRYLKEKYSSFEGKADLAVLFVERCLNLIRKGGSIGLIIQRRWFKTSYGEKARTLISRGNYLHKLLDIGTTDMFPGRITYVSIMVLKEKTEGHVEYDYIPGTRLDVINYFSKERTRQNVPATYFCDRIWSPEFYMISEIRDRYAQKLGTLKDNKNIHIRDGIQALWKKVYHLTEYRVMKDTVYGKNGFGDEVEIEKEMVKPVIYNRMFLPLKELLPDAYCIFPYRGVNNRVKISMTELKENYPKTYRYLKNNEARIKKNVKCNEGDYWHTFTREHNHEWFDSRKVVIPMTSKDTFATYVSQNGFYMDNSNVWFINLESDNDIELKAITLLINSTVFSVFAKSGANSQSGNYYKYNKQFLLPIPFPNCKIKETDPLTQKLADYYDDITQYMRNCEDTAKRNKIYFEGILEKKWDEVDKICNELYELGEQDWVEIKKVGRELSRVTGKEG